MGARKDYLQEQVLVIMVPGTWEFVESKIYVDGQEVKFVAYNIGGYNYFKLRDLAKVLNFAVLWDGGNNSIKVDTSQAYSEL